MRRRETRAAGEKNTGKKIKSSIKENSKYSKERKKSRTSNSRKEDVKKNTHKHKFNRDNSKPSSKKIISDNKTNFRQYPAVNLGEIRLNKFISDSGFCSRREADTYISMGKVKVNGAIAGIGSKINNRCEVIVNNNLIENIDNTVYIALNKPVGITSTTEHNIKGNVVDFVNYKERIFPIGRLDKESEGLLLLTNDGDIVNKILRAGNNHEKEYFVRVNKKITEDFILRMSNGIPMLGTVTKKCKVRRVDDYTFNITLIQGLNRQIRRMCEYLNYEVTALKRDRIMNIKLGNLPIGKWRFLTDKEINDVQKMISNSDNDRKQ